MTLRSRTASLLRRVADRIDPPPILFGSMVDFWRAPLNAGQGFLNSGPMLGELIDPPKDDGGHTYIGVGNHTFKTSGPNNEIKSIDGRNA